MTKKVKTINKINASWEPLGRMPEISDSGTFSMRGMQSKAFKTLSSYRYAILNAPTSSGKTLAICWLIAKALLDNPSMKAIITVPQIIIANGFKGFFDLSFKDLNGSLLSDTPNVGWSPCHYLCAPTPDSNVAQIASFLRRKGSKLDINDRILICSHASLVNAFEKHKDLFTNVSLCIDEMHHSKFAETEDGEYCNQLGKVISYSLRHKERSINLLLSTATPYRGDRIDVIPQKYMDEFKTFYYPMDEYLKDCKWLKNFSYDFAMYDKSWGKRLTELFAKSVGKTIIYLPSVGSKYYSYGSKHADVQEIYKSIAGSKNPIIKKQDNGLILIKKGKKWIKVINLVEDGPIREIRSKLIIDAHNYEDNSKIDVIITLNMFREGANWKWANRGIIIGSKGSLTDMIQIIGRFLRDARDKTKVDIIQLLPYSFDQLDKEKFRDNLNEYSKAIFATMLLEDAISPVKIKIPIKKESSGGGCPDFEIEIDYLRMQAKDENHILKIWEEIRNEAIIVQDVDKVDFKMNTKKTRKIFRDIVSEVLTGNGIKHHHDDIAEHIRKRWIRESLKNIKKIIGVDLSEVDFDTIEINPLQFWLTYSSGMLGLDTCRDFRKAIARTFYLPYEEAREKGRKAAKDYRFTTQYEYKDWKRGKRKDLPPCPEGMPLDLRVYGKRVYGEIDE
ncbi:MAG: DEAD/DEAH box helicase family protein [Synergistaceae bacterium]